MSVESLTPKQEQVAREVLAVDDPRPAIDPTISERALDALRHSLVEALDLIPADDQLNVRDRDLQQVLGCERRWHEETWDGWTIEKLRGAVAHLAIERMLLARMRPDHEAPSAHEAVAGAFDRLSEDTSQPERADFLRTLPADDRHELLRDAADATLKFEMDWPPLDLREWRPRVESRSTYSLFGDDRRILLKTKFDLALGVSQRDRAGVLIVDLKTGNQHESHHSQLRYYALVETLVRKAPPFRIAAYYLDSGQPWIEDVTETTFDLAIRRVVDGVNRMTQLRYGGRAPEMRPSSLCRNCTLLDDCTPGQNEVRKRAAVA